MDDKTIPRIRVNRHDMERIFGLFAGLQECEAAAAEMEKRFRAIPNGWRDLRLVTAKLNKLIENVLMTVPPEKIDSMLRMLPRMHYSITCGPQASDGAKDECIISMHDLNVLTAYAHEHCKLCIDGECSRCALGRTFDSVLTYDRDGRSWAGVDLAAIYKAYAQEAKKC